MENIKANHEIRLPLSGWLFRGVALVEMWGGGKATVTMEDKTIKVKPTGQTEDQLTREMIVDNEIINDGEFGVETIYGAKLDIYARYGYHEEYKGTVCISIHQGYTDDDIADQLQDIEIW